MAARVCLRGHWAVQKHRYLPLQSHWTLEVTILRSKWLLERAFEATGRSKCLLGRAFEAILRSKLLLRRVFEATHCSNWLHGRAFEATWHSKFAARALSRPWGGQNGCRRALLRPLRAKETAQACFCGGHSKWLLEHAEAMVR